MRYNIHGFSQRVAVELGLDNDHLLLLRWFVDFAATGKMKTLTIENKTYHWIHYQKVCDDLPILATKTDTLYRKLKKLEKCNVIKQHTKRDKDGTYSYFAFSDAYESLISDSVTEVKEPVKGITEGTTEGTETNPRGYGEKSDGGTENFTDRGRKKILTKDISITLDQPIIKNSSISDIQLVSPLVSITMTESDPLEKKNSTDGQTDELSKIYEQAQIEIFEGDAFKETLKNIITDAFSVTETRAVISKLCVEHIDQAIYKYREAKDAKNIKNPKLYFQRCLLSAIREEGLNNLFAI